MYSAVFYVMIACATFLPTVLVPRQTARLWSINAAAKISLADAVMSFVMSFHHVVMFVWQRVC